MHVPSHDNMKTVGNTVYVKGVGLRLGPLDVSHSQIIKTSDTDISKLLQ